MQSTIICDRVPLMLLKSYSAVNVRFLYLPLKADLPLTEYRVEQMTTKAGSMPAFALWVAYGVVVAMAAPCPLPILRSRKSSIFS